MLEFKSTASSSYSQIYLPTSVVGLYRLSFSVLRIECISIAGTVVWESNYGLESCAERQDAPDGNGTTSVHETITKTLASYNAMQLQRLWSV